ncbi:MAG: glycosyltransferase family 2 protein [Acidobacteria bacterium]|nr:glycosyltransferase family 2 protein [Acidobacteriota bacterium]
MHTFLSISNQTLFVYYFLSNLAYLVLLVVAICTSALHQRKLASLRLENLNASPFSPPISLLVPAHNEEKTIVEALRSLLALEYPEVELIVINDGSTDSTLDVLREHFSLVETDILYIPEVPSKPVRGLYVSRNEPRLVVVDKEAGGSKADAVNAGFNVSTSPYVCVLDADSILERDALLRIMTPILTDPRKLAGVGGIVRVVNGSAVAGGKLQEIRLPRKPVEIIQVVEYLRAFLIGREGWAQGNMLLIISGAFGVFSRDLVKAIGGYRASAIGEDFDLVMRLHRHLRDTGADYHIGFVPDPVCWTEVPSDLTSLGRQRARWQKGLFDVLLSNRDMLFRKKYGRIGSFAMPYMWLFELFAPVIEIVGYATIVLAAVLGVLSREFFLQFLLFGYLFATLISIGSVLQEEITYKRYNHWRDVAWLVAFCFLEHFPYRQMHMWWRLRGLWQFLRGDMKWQRMKRVGFQSA